jgi:hypothetical protein
LAFGQQYVGVVNLKMKHSSLGAAGAVKGARKEGRDETTPVGKDRSNYVDRFKRARSFLRPDRRGAAHSAYGMQV